MWRYDLQDEDTALSWCTAVNEYLADVVASHPARFAAMGIVPLQFPVLAGKPRCRTSWRNQNAESLTSNP